MKGFSVHAILMFVAFAAIAGCLTSSSVLVGLNLKPIEQKSAYVVLHGGSGADMDANVQKEFLRHGFAVSAGPDGGVAPGTSLIVRYADDWKWDLAMYLRSLDVMVFGAHSNVLLATGSWKNSLFHGFYDSQKIVAQVVDDTVSKIP